MKRRNDAVRHVHVHLSPEIEESIKVLREALRKDETLNRSFSTRYLAIKLLEGDSEVASMVNPDDSNQEIIILRNQEVKRIERLLGEDAATAIADEKYGYISGALAETLQLGEKEREHTTRIIDSVVTSKMFGFRCSLL